MSIPARPRRVPFVPPICLQLAVLMLVFLCQPHLHALPPSTTTALEISPGNSVPAGSRVTLKATVTLGGKPVFPGLVLFCNAAAPYCTDIHILGRKQLTSAGAATLNAILPPGVHDIKAVFQGTNIAASSTSATETLTVAAASPRTYPTVTTIAAAGSPGNYSLSGAVTSPASPLTGNLSFIDLTNGNNSLGSPALGPETVTFLPLPPTLPSGNTPLLVGDFNNDGILDEAVGTTGAYSAGSIGGVSILLGNGDGKFTLKSYIPFPAGQGFPGEFENLIALISSGDFNNDGIPDLTVAIRASDRESYGYFVGFPLYILLGKGDGTFTVAPTLAAAAAVVGDFNGDGNADLALEGEDCGDVCYNLLTTTLGNGDGTFTLTSSRSSVYVDYFNNAYVADFNGDGKLDLVLDNGDPTLLLGNGDGTFTAGPSLPANGPVTAADFNGDGKVDLAIGHDFYTGVFSILLSNGDGTFSLGSSITGAQPGQLGVGDFNGDGIADLVWASSDSLGVYLGAGDGSFSNGNGPGIPASTTSGIYVSGDFNNDGRTDLVIGDANSTTLSLVQASATIQGVAPGGTPGPHQVLAKYTGSETQLASSSSPLPIEVPNLDFADGFGGAGAALQLNGSGVIAGSGLQLANGGPNEASSAFAKTPLNVQSFTTDFAFQIANPVGDGFTFTIQNDKLSAIGGPGGGLGYSNIPKSLAIKFDLFSNAGEGPDSTGLYVDGAHPSVPSIKLTGTGIDLHSGDRFKAHITYDGVALVLTITDTVTSASWSHAWPINIPATVGGTSAWIGFTGATGGQTSTETITAWTYQVGTPAPNYPAGFATGTAALTLNGSAQAAGESFNGALQLTGPTPMQAGSAYYATPQNIQEFASDFTFQIANPVGDGFTFVIQNDKPAAIGGSGSGLGYADIPRSIAIKFDTFDNAGEGSDSTGLYIDGARPTVPAIDLSYTGISLHSGDTLYAHIIYDGANLSLTLTDPVAMASWTHTWPINIPATVGGDTAWVGFTGATGTATSSQEIESWTFVPGAP